VDKRNIPREIKNRKLKWKPYIENKGLFIIEEDRKVAHRMIHYSSCITSYARVELYKYLFEYADNIIYCDTDCIHLHAKKINEKYLSGKIGLMKHEESGKAIYTGRKQYAINNKLKFKGIKVNCKLSGNKFILDNYLEILHNGITKYEYETFPKLKSILKEREKSCKKQKILKELRNPVYLSNYKPNYKKRNKK